MPRTFSSRPSIPRALCRWRASDHLLSGKRDAAYVADVIAAWAERYIEPVAAQPAAAASEAPRNVVVRETRNSKFQQTVTIRSASDAGG